MNHGIGSIDIPNHKEAKSAEVKQKMYSTSDSSFGYKMSSSGQLKFGQSITDSFSNQMLHDLSSSNPNSKKEENKHAIIIEEESEDSVKSN